MKKFLLTVLIPVVFVVLFTCTLVFPDFGAVVGGPAVFTGFIITLLTYLYVVFTGLSLQEMTKAQEAQRRPYVTVDLEFEEFSGWIVIANVGKLPAFDVRIQFDPELTATRNRKLSETLFREPISFIPPGKILRSFVDVGKRLLDEEQPAIFKARVSYKGIDGATVFNEAYSINLDFYRHRLSTRHASLDEVSKWLEVIAKQISFLQKNRKPRAR